jgi:hypothetical protein
MGATKQQQEYITTYIYALDTSSTQSKPRSTYMRFEVRRTMTIKIAVIWNVMPSNSIDR